MKSSVLCLCAMALLLGMPCGLDAFFYGGDFCGGTDRGLPDWGFAQSQERRIEGCSVGEGLIESQETASFIARLLAKSFCGEGAWTYQGLGEKGLRDRCETQSGWEERQGGVYSLEIIPDPDTAVHAPEPATLVLVGSGLLGLVVLGRKFKLRNT